MNRQLALVYGGGTVGLMGEIATAVRGASPWDGRAARSTCRALCQAALHHDLKYHHQYCTSCWLGRASCMPAASAAAGHVSSPPHTAVLLLPPAQVAKGAGEHMVHGVIPESLTGLEVSRTGTWGFIHHGHCASQLVGQQ